MHLARIFRSESCSRASSLSLSHYFSLFASSPFFCRCVMSSFWALGIGHCADLYPSLPSPAPSRLGTILAGAEITTKLCRKLVIWSSSYSARFRAHHCSHALAQKGTYVHIPCHVCRVHILVGMFVDQGTPLHPIPIPSHRPTELRYVLPRTMNYQSSSGPGARTNQAPGPARMDMGRYTLFGTGPTRPLHTRRFAVANLNLEILVRENRHVRSRKQTYKLCT